MMDPLLVKVAEEYHMKAGIEKEILQVEKNKKKKKSRHTRGPIKQIITKMSGEEDSDQ